MPAARLQTLLNDTAPDLQQDLKDTMRQQLMGNSERMINQMLAVIGNSCQAAPKPQRNHRVLRCWGDSKISNSNWTTRAQRSCQTDHNIYVSSSLIAGKINSILLAEAN